MSVASIAICTRVDSQWDHLHLAVVTAPEIVSICRLDSTRESNTSRLMARLWMAYSGESLSLAHLEYLIEQVLLPASRKRHKQPIRLEHGSPKGKLQRTKTHGFVVDWIFPFVSLLLIKTPDKGIKALLWFFFFTCVSTPRNVCGCHSW